MVFLHFTKDDHEFRITDSFVCTGLATIPKPVKAVARVADDSPAEREPRPTAEMCVIECVLLYFFATCLWWSASKFERNFAAFTTIFR